MQISDIIAQLRRRAAELDQVHATDESKEGAIRAAYELREQDELIEEEVPTMFGNEDQSNRTATGAAMMEANFANRNRF